MKITFNFLIVLCCSFITVDSNNMFFNNAVNFYSKDDFSHSKQEFLKCKGINDSTIKAEIYFYLGNIDYKEQKYFEAIDNYKNALRLNSSFNEAKNNLVLARLKLNEEKRKNKNPDLQNSSTKQTNEILLESKLLENKALEKANNNENKNNHSQQIKNW